MNPFRAMKSPLIPLFSLLLLGSLPLSAVEVDYINDIMPIFKAKCFECHSVESGKAKGNLEFDHLEDMEEFYIGKFTTMRPYNPEESLLLEFVSDPDSDDTMPPSGKGERLTADEIAKVRQWLAEGAVMDKTKVKPPTPIAERPILQWTNFEGKSIPAKYVKLTKTKDGEAVVLMLKNGSTTTYPLAKLSEESQKQAQENAKKIGS